MHSQRRKVYWNADVWLSYINGEPDRLPTLDTLLADSASDKGSIEIYTSAISQVEVAFGKAEQDQKALSPEIEAKINQLWADRSAVKLIEYHESVGGEARKFIRLSMTKGWSLKPMDAIHLATAKWCQLTDPNQQIEFHTYDEPLLKYSNDVGFPIVIPYVQQPRLHP